MDALYKKIGEQQVALDSLNVEYDKLLALTSGLATGAIEPARVTVDLQNRSWSIKPVLIELPPAASAG